MANKKNSKKPRSYRAEAKTPETPQPGGGMHAARETIESIVIAFVLAFLFRTFEAEAFVIPTGSMSPSLQGQHKDVDCTECGYRFRTTASSEGESTQELVAQLRNPGLSLPQRSALEQDLRSLQVVTGLCPMCRQTMAMRPDLPAGIPKFVNAENVEQQTSYPGDRILVNKYEYNNRTPDRWDVVVFKFPGNGEVNYIKRLVGLPNETLRIFQGDIFIRDDAEQTGFQIERKPADKVAAMLQPVHDTNYDPSTLYNAGWPLRWEPQESSGWHVQTETDATTVRQHYHFTAAQEDNTEQTSWLAYRHYVPRDADWSIVREFQSTGNYRGVTKEEWIDGIQPELIRDFNAYNTSRLRGGSLTNLRRARKRFPPGILDPNQGWGTPEDLYGLNWVGDLAVECDVEITTANGQLTLDLIEAGVHFTCKFNLQTGEALVEVQGFTDFSTTVNTPLTAPGEYDLRFANVDDQLLLWIDGELVSLSPQSEGLHYDADQVFGTRKNAIPSKSEDDLGDLAPVRIGAQGAKLTVNRLQVLRDIYYIATNHGLSSQKCDYPMPSANRIKQMFTDTDAWSLFLEREPVEFTIKDEQLFVMGDNSPASLDCRLWSTPQNDSYPGGAYLDRRLLIGKAVCVFWPHSWGEIPGASILPGFPNFGDMRIVR